MAHIPCFLVNPTDVSPTQYFVSSGVCDFGPWKFLRPHFSLLPTIDLQKCQHFRAPNLTVLTSPRSDGSDLIRILRIGILCVTRLKDLPPSFVRFPKCRNPSWTINDPDLSLINDCDLIANSRFTNSHRLTL
jgi:hypothetical protein